MNGGTYTLGPAIQHFESESSSKRLKTAHNQNSASGLAASKKEPSKGLGTVPYTGVRIFQNVERLFWDGKPLDVSGSAEMKSMIQILESCRISGPMSLIKVSETKEPNNIQQVFLDGIANHFPFSSLMTTGRVFHDKLIGAAARSNATLGLFLGIASSGSTMDGYLHTESKSMPCVSAVWEVKNDCASPKEGNLEAIANATNVALGMLTRGISMNDVVVPIFSTNGMYAATY